MVMSLQCPVGPETNLLEITPEHCARMLIEHPILTLEQMQSLKDSQFMNWKTVTIDCTIPVNAGAVGMEEALVSICEQVCMFMSIFFQPI